MQIPVGIGYADDIAKARAAILQALHGINPVLRDPAPAVVVNDLGASSVDLLVFAWIEDAQDEKPVFFTIVEAAKLALDHAGVEMPSPQMELSLESIEPRVWEAAGRNLLPQLKARIAAGGPARMKCTD